MSVDILTDETPTVITVEQVDGGGGDWDDDLVHICCDACDAHLALCGGELADMELETFEDDELCVVCLDLAKGEPPCVSCGKPVIA